MKAPKLILATVALCISLASFSQGDTTKSKKDTTAKKDTTLLSSPQASKTTLQSTTNQSQAGTTSQSASAASTSVNTHETAPKPNFGRYYIPVLGNFQASEATAENKSVTISGDESNPGKIWIEGLGTSKFYALLKTLPGTYKIPAQNQDASNVLEGTVIYDDATKQVDICLGCGFRDVNPAEILAANNEAAPVEKAVKGKNRKSATKVAPVKKIITFSGVKSDHTTASAQ